MNAKSRSRLAMILRMLLLLCAAVYVGLAILGGILHYSPVPYWDMWDSYIGFFGSVSNGNTAAWWAQHNEHRIVFSKLLFWLDLEILRNGTTPFLIVCNFLFAAGTAFVFLRFLKAALPDEDDRRLRFITGALIWVFAFAWIQEENFTWAFQSQFFAAHLFPLGALYLLGRSLSLPTGRNMRFAAACALGVISAGTMANGVLALPLMALTAIAVRVAGWRRILILILLAAVVVLAYFSDYQAPPHHGKLTDALLRPLDFLNFILRYLGNPVYFFTGGNVLAAMLAGSVLLLGVVFFTVRILRVSRPDPIQVSLLAFVAYVLATAVAVAGGRLALGMESAHAGRYTTPTLMLWSALLILGVVYFGPVIRRVLPGAAGAVVVVSLLLLPSQWRAVHVDQPVRFEKLVAALALELNVNDVATLVHIYPHADIVLRHARAPSVRDLSIFGHPAIKDAAQALGQAPPPLEIGEAVVACSGYLDEISEVAQDPRFLKVRGWIFHPVAASVPESAAIVDGNGRIVGHAVTGSDRPDVAKVVNSRAGRSGFAGYVLAERRNSLAFLHGQEPACRLAVTIPVANPKGR